MIIRIGECGSEVFTQPMILILTNKWDITADFVVLELRRRNQVFLRLNTEELPLEKATISIPNLQISVSKQGKIHDLSNEINVIWNRRPGKPFDDIDANERPSQAIQKFVNDQWYSWLEALQLLPKIAWINHPLANDAMESKSRQLQLASQLGFEIPQTFISNDPTVIKAFLKKNDNRIIGKALFSPLIEDIDQDLFIFTNEINEISEECEEEIKLSPCIFQEYINPKIDYRVTVIGEIVLSVKIESEIKNDPISVDWRTQKNNLKFTQCDLPKQIEKLCVEFVKKAGLVFGAIDLVEHNSKFYFLEINPNGEWGWLQKPNGLPIAEALCDLMIEIDNKTIT